jgi:hypothetical protein
MAKLLWSKGQLAQTSGSAAHNQGWKDIEESDQAFRRCRWHQIEGR